MAYSEGIREGFLEEMALELGVTNKQEFTT